MVWVILLVFALTGFTVMYLKKFVKPYLGEDWWVDMVYYILILPVYNLLRSILVEHGGADAEQLEHFASIIFIRQNGAAGIASTVVGHVEILPHGGLQCDVFQDLTEINEGVGHQHVFEGCRDGGPNVLDHGDDEDLTECECHALTELIGLIDGVVQEARSEIRLTIQSAVVG